HRARHHGWRASLPPRGPRGVARLARPTRAPRRSRGIDVGGRCDTRGMEPLLIGLVAATLVVGLVLLVLVVLLSRGVRGVRGGAPDAQESVRGEIRDLATLLRDDLGRQRAELSEQLHRAASTARTAEEQ